MASPASSVFRRFCRTYNDVMTSVNPDPFLIWHVFEISESFKRLHASEIEFYNRLSCSSALWKDCGGRNNTANTVRLAYIAADSLRPKYNQLHIRPLNSEISIGRSQ